MKFVTIPAILFFFLLPSTVRAQAVSFEEAVVDVGNIGLTITNAGFIGRANVRNNPTGPPSMEYPLDSGVEHLFESGLWVGARRSDGVTTVRTGAVTAAGGYRPGATGYEFAQAAPILERSSLPTSEVFTRSAVSHQDYLTAFVDTATVLPGTSIQMPDPQGRLGMAVELETFAWNFPFTEYFVILNWKIINISEAAWEDVYVGMYHDLVVRNVNTTTDAGGAFFNKGGFGYLDSLYASYAFNAGGTEETLNTYGAMAFLGAEWQDPASGRKRFFHPGLADAYEAEGLPRPRVNPRWWLFSGGTDELGRPTSDEERYRRMATPFPNPDAFENPADFEAARDAWFERLRTDGQNAAGNWIGLTPVGPVPRVEPGDTLTVTFAVVAALKPEAFQGQAGKPVDTPESRALLENNIRWAQRTYAGEDNNLNGELDPGEDVNGNGVLDRYLIPEPPSPPHVRVVFEDTVDPRTGQQDTKALIYWDRSAELSRDPVTGTLDFEGYRIYRSNPGDDRAGNILDRATLIAQYDRPGNRTGFNNGFAEVALDEPVTFPGDPTEYWYRFEADDLLAGWQYLFIVTAFDEGDPDAGLPSFESSRTATATRVFPGTPPDDGSRRVGVYPNPYRVNAAWDGGTNRTRRLNFYNLPPRAEIRIYTLAGEVVKTLHHDAETYRGDIRWYDNFSADNRVLPGGEHSWDILSENGLNLATGLYLFTVKNLDTGDTQQGKFVIIK
ncbi:MAG: hypothetical protein KatS3mg044_0367 [Rhodothermaceae bacterium]|nr:MAG: hypothetical protein KatS3mg044_0367 [Rhodothermaceae bacterium]